MDVVKTFKDIVSFAQKSNDIEMMQKLMSAQQEVLAMNAKLMKLEEENKKLKSKAKIERNIERYPGTTLITLKNENPKIPYCSTCYGNDGSLIQMKIRGELCECSNCKSYFYFAESSNSNVRNLFK